MPIDEADREKLKLVAIRASLFFGLGFGLPVIVFFAINGLRSDGFASILLILSSLLSISLLLFRRFKNRIFYISLAVCASLWIYLFVPTWIMAIQAKTPQEHLLVAEAYAARGQLFANEHAAWRHYLIAAEGGNAEAQFIVGGGYLYGSYGVTRDREKARYWMKAAAAQGHKWAQRSLPDIDTVPF